MTVVIISLTFRARLLSSSSGFSRTFITVSHENSGLPFPSQVSNTRAKQSIQLYPSVVFGTGFFLKIHPGHRLIQCASLAKCPTNPVFLTCQMPNKWRTFGILLDIPWSELETYPAPGGGGGGGEGGMEREREREGEKKWERANVFSVHNVN